MRSSVIGPGFPPQALAGAEVPAAVLVGLALLVAGCQPTLNWREVRPADLALTLLLPCKPDRGQRTTDIGAYKAQISMVGCEAAGGLYAVSRITLAPDVDAAQVQVAWQQSVLRSMSASTFETEPYRQPGASPIPAPILLRTTGRTPQGGEVQMRGIWFTYQGSLYHAALYQQVLNAESADTFFSGLKIQ